MTWSRALRGLALAVCLPAVGCATLTVTVDLYTGDLVLRQSLTEQVAAIEESKVCAADDPGAALFAEVEEDWREAVKKVNPSADAEAEWREVAAQIGGSWSATITPEIVKVCAVSERAKKALASDADAGLALLYAEVQAARERVNDSVNALAKALDSPQRSLIMSVVPQAFVSSSIASDDAANGRIAGFPVFDPNVKQLLEEDASAWKTSNQVTARARGGDSQFVLVQRGLMTFHQKSLDFDPGKVIAMVAQTARTGLEIAAKVVSSYTGVAIPIGGGQAAAPEQADVAAGDSEAIARVDRIIEDRQRVIDRCLLDLSSYLKDLPTGANAEVLEKKNQEFEALVRECQGKLDEVVRK